MTPYGENDLGNMGSGNGLLPDGNTLLPETVVDKSNIWTSQENAYVSLSFGWEWRSNFITHFIMGVITFPCWD